MIHTYYLYPSLFNSFQSRQVRMNPGIIMEAESLWLPKKILSCFKQVRRLQYKIPHELLPPVQTSFMTRPETSLILSQWKEVCKLQSHVLNHRCFPCLLLFFFSSSSLQAVLFTWIMHVNLKSLENEVLAWNVLQRESLLSMFLLFAIHVVCVSMDCHYFSFSPDSLNLKEGFSCRQSISFMLLFFTRSLTDWNLLLPHSLPHGNDSSLPFSYILSFQSLKPKFTEINRYIILNHTYL